MKRTISEFAQMLPILLVWTLVLALSAVSLQAQDAVKEAPKDGPAPKGWNKAVQTVHYLSKADDSYQPALFYVPEEVKDSGEKIPLIVGLHTWSSDFKQVNSYFYEGAKKYGWALICPNFRGSNTKPEACGSELAVADIVFAVEYAKSRLPIDSNRIYLMGMSGGGHCSMLMAGRHPEIWAGVCSWVGISDLAAWHASTRLKNLGYWKHLEKVCGGAPNTSPEVDEQYRLRSPLTWLANASEVPLSINHGIHDGHSGSVPVSQGIWAFNLLAAPEKQVSEAQIRYFCETQEVPPELKTETEDDPLFGSQKVLFKRSCGNVQLTIFDGGHGGAPMAGFAWLAKQKKGQKADWKIDSQQNPADSRAVLSGK